MICTNLHREDLHRKTVMRELSEADGGELHELGDDALGLVAGGEGAGFDPYG